MYKRTPDGRHNLDKLKIKIPVFGLLQTKSACASFARTMSTLLQAGMPMIDALEISASTMKNVLFYDALEKVKNGVSLGLPLSNQLGSTGLFPPMVVHMVNIGEETGNVEEMLTNSAGYYDDGTNYYYSYGSGSCNTYSFNLSANDSAVQYTW